MIDYKKLPVSKHKVFLESMEHIRKLLEVKGLASEENVKEAFMLIGASLYSHMKVATKSKRTADTYLNSGIIFDDYIPFINDTRIMEAIYDKFSKDSVT